VEDLPEAVRTHVQNGDVVLIMGAGSIGQVAGKLTGVNHAG
jgi:UDP-N-acetylmuramate--alanine ligase